MSATPGFWLRVLLGFAVAMVVVAATAGGSGDTASQTDSVFYASAGWTIPRAADLSVDMQRDDGIPKTQAQCAMKAIVGDTTWLEWEAMSDAGRFVAIRVAEAGC